MDNPYTLKAIKEEVQRKKNIKRIQKVKVKEKFFFILSIISISFLIFQFFFYIVIHPRFLLKYININKDFALDNNILIQELDLKKNIYSFFIDTKFIKKQLENTLLFENVSVRKDKRDTLFISLEPRKPLAYIQINNKFYLTDKEGFVFSDQKKDLSLPIIVLSSDKKEKIPFKLSDQIVFLLNNLYYLKQEASYFYEIISEINLVNYQNDFFDLLISIQRTEIPFLMRMPLEKRDLNNLLIIYNILLKDVNTFHKVKEIDYRTYNPVLVLK